MLDWKLFSNNVGLRNSLKYKRDKWILLRQYVHIAHSNLASWYIPLISILGRKKQEFKANLSYEILFQRTKRIKKNIQREYTCQILMIYQRILIILSFPNIYLFETRLSCITPPTINYNGLNEETDVIIQLSSVKPDIKFTQCKTMSSFLLSLSCLGTIK